MVVGVVAHFDWFSKMIIYIGLTSKRIEQEIEEEEMCCWKRPYILYIKTW